MMEILNALWVKGPWLCIYVHVKKIQTYEPSQILTLARRITCQARNQLELRQAFIVCSVGSDNYGSPCFRV